MDDERLYRMLFGNELKKAEKAKIKIGQATLDLVAEIGIRSLSFEKIGVACEMKKALVRYYFKSIDDILTFNLKFGYIHAQQLTVEALNKTRPGGLRRILTVSSTAFDWAEAYPKEFSLTISVAALASYKPEVKSLMASIRSTGLERLQAIICEDLKCTPKKAEKVALSVQMAIQGSMIDYALTGRFPLATYRTRTATMIKLICQGSSLCDKDS